MKEAVTWTALAVIIFIASAQQNAAAPQATISPAAPNKRLCSISGSVTDVATNQGLTRAYLRLTGKAGSYAAVTDERARFVFEAVEPGTYLLEAEHQGYIDGRFGDTDGPAVEIKLTAAQTLSDIFVRLTPQAVISGRVVNEDGDPWTHAHVNLFRSQWSRGHPKIEGFDSGSANDEGEFRIGQLPPGKYYLAAEPDAGWEIRNRPSGKDVLSRQATWYPNSLDLDGAASIIVGPGSHISGLEIRLRRGSTHRIRGTLLGSDNISIDESHGPFGGRSIFAEKTSVAAVNGRAGAINSDGSFEIAEVPSGIYEIRVRQGLPPIGLGTIKVQVEDRDVDDVSIQLIPPRPVKGMIQIEEQGSMKPAGLTIRLESFGPSWGPSTVSRADGGFDFPQVGSERYRVIVSGNSGNGFYLKQIRYGDAVSNDETISLTGVGGGLVLLLSTHGAQLTGRTVSPPTADQSKSTFAKAQVVLIPSAAPARLGTFDQTGTFTFQDLAPGLYKLYAFEGVPDGAWEDSDFMKELAGAGLEIRLAEGEVKSADVPLIYKSDLALTLKKLGME